MKPIVSRFALAVFAFSLVAPMARGEQAAAGRAAATATDDKRPAPEEYTLSGTVSKEESTVKDRGGKESKLLQFVLTEANGNKTVLPPAEAQGTRGGTTTEAQGAAYDLETFLGKEVTLTGMGYKRGDKIGLQKITKIAAK
ncbi:MAG: hypothetical protein HYU36_10900 [Planctomycetes bacterium]|nr:hypothetical protein [Planctomycetota bacterium]